LELTEDTVFEIYKTVKNSDVEEIVWRRLVFLYDKPLTKQIVFDLIDRKIALLELGHTKQDYDVMWKLAEIVDEALLTLAIDIYTNRTFGIEETEILFNKFYDHKWMLETLIRTEPSSIEKRRLLEAALQRNIDADSLQRLLTVMDNAKLARRNDLSIEEFHALFQMNEPYVWLSLSINPKTPADILNRLVDVRDIKNAKRIRNSARINLRKKS
jgi:hypothetical protein